MCRRYKKGKKKETKKVQNIVMRSFICTFNASSATVFMFETVNMMAVTLFIFYHGITTLQGKQFISLRIFFFFFFTSILSLHMYTLYKTTYRLTIQIFKTIWLKWERVCSIGTVQDSGALHREFKPRGGGGGKG